MDDYFIKNILWNTCNNPINAIDFSASLEVLEELVATLEMLGITPFEPITETLSNNTEDRYLTLEVKETCVVFTTCDERIAPVPVQYLNTVLPALILAHINNPVSVKQVYNDFFANKKEEITPLLDQ